MLRHNRECLMHCGIEGNRNHVAALIIKYISRCSHHNCYPPDLFSSPISLGKSSMALCQYTVLHARIIVDARAMLCKVQMTAPKV